MRSLRHGLRHEKMIEGIAVMKRKSRKSDKMRICDIQPVESLTRQDRKNLFYIGIKFADPQLHRDFLKGDGTDEDVVLRIADKASRMIPQLLVVVQPPQQGMRIEQHPHVPSSMDFRTSSGRLSKSSATLIFPRNAPGFRVTTSDDGGPISATTL
ncbi:hypothetical protein ABIE78_002655 [Sinorhizobium fredii]